MSVIWVALGGALGAVMRFGAGRAVMRLGGGDFPYGTFVVNVLGSFLMGLLAMGLLAKTGREEMSLFLITGVLGGFTTFSAFSLDAMRLLEQGRIPEALAYIFGSMLLSLLALWAGAAIARGF